MNGETVKLPEGLTLRDYFAGQALAGLVYCADLPEDTTVARDAYALADAMLKERAKP